MGRVLPGLLMVAVWLLLLWQAPQWLFALVIAALGVLGAREYLAMTGISRLGLGAAAPVVILLLPLAAAWTGQADDMVIALFFSLLGAALLVLWQYRRLEGPAAPLMALVFGACYVGFCLSHLVLLFGLPQGRAWIFVLSGITAASDTGAYYSGRAWGRHKLCPHISPGKTREGAVGGVIAAVGAALAIGVWLLPQVSPVRLALAAVVLALVGIVGDLAESVLKRAYGVKDSGTLLAGHGGVLDRGDSLLLAAPFLYALLSKGLL
ncbi:MAG: hypothetical protein BWK76_00975 [Desulfobulbaceae bacterium A2]|nr:MAG: hypothetical protein BWK76_00975 [Desulfobulbaceae bacterium A2]